MWRRSMTGLDLAQWQVLDRRYPVGRALAAHGGVAGSAAAWFNLGQQHYFGKGVEVSYEQAAECYRQAFERGMLHAAAALGDLYEEEICDAEQDWQVDLVEALRWFMKGAKRGEARCRFEVGYRFYMACMFRAIARRGCIGWSWLLPPG